MTVALSVVVTTHGEGRLLRPTLRSVAESLEPVCAEDEAELVLVCDSPDEATDAEVARWARRDDLPFAVRRVDTALGEPGPARNAGIQEARGEFVALVDGDDLVSRDYFAASLALLRASDAPTLTHPSLVVSFGPRSLLWEVDSTSAGGFDYRDLLRHNLWPSASAGRRSIYLEHPYPSLPPGRGFGPEDWMWNIETASAGIAHEAVPGTIFFYRLRESGGINNRHAHSVLPPFDIAALRARFPAAIPSAPSTRRSPRRVAMAAGRRAYRAALPLARRVTKGAPPELRTLIYKGGDRVVRTLTGRRTMTRRMTATPEITATFAEAAELDPAISWTASRYEELEVWHPRDDGFGAVIDQALIDLGEVDALVTVPWVGVGGADIVSINYARALSRVPRYEGRTAFLGTYLGARTRLELVPPGVRYAHLQERWLRLPREWRHRLIAQLIVFAQPELVVSVNSFHVTQALRDHEQSMLEGRRLYATIFAFDRIGHGYPVNPITDDSQRRYLDRIDGVITDNSTTRDLIGDILALEPPRVLVQRQPVSDSTPELPRGTRAYNNEHFSELNPFRLIWPHRLDEEKRPDVVARIARALRDRGLPVQIDVWGQRVLTAHGDSLMSDLRAAGVVYRGPYSGGLFSLPTYEYHGLLLTSKSEGLPLVLVQALFRGLPVIASNVGGVRDIVLDGETGMLTDGPDDIAGYVDAVERLLVSRELRRTLIEGGYAFAVEHHSWEAFQELVERSLIP